MVLVQAIVSWTSISGTSYNLSTEVTTEETYYFRGAVNNNWVKFGKDSSNKDIYWRIIRINGDGSIRMIYRNDSSIK